ncbi:Down syndrome cell adhesion molecule, partial [Harpegnathos saltator]
CSVKFALGQQGPVFVLEPPSTLVFSNTTGSQLGCSAHGSPTPHVTWITSPDQRSVTAVPGLRQLLGNGTLYFPPFLAQDFRAEVHNARYRCRATSSVGTVLSREVTLRAVLTVPGYDVRVNRQPVMEGCNAVLSCTAREDVKEHLTVTSWFRDEAILLPGNTDTGGRFVVTSQGDLHIRAARPEDGRATYSCLTLHALTSERKRSEPASLTVTEPSGSSPPRLMQRSEIAISAESGSDVHLTCSAQGSPPPQFTWYRDVNGHSMSVESLGRIQLWGDLMLIRRVDADDAGRYVCRASNQLGEQRAETHLSVTSKLNARIQPRVQAKGFPPPRITWLRARGRTSNDYQPLVDGSDGRLTILPNGSLWTASAGPQDEGYYLCRANNGIGSGLSKVIYVSVHEPARFEFQSKNVTIHRGESVTIDCTVIGDNPIEVQWMHNSDRLDMSNHRLSIGEIKTDNGLKSQLSIANSDRQDSGVYRCTANNAYGRSEHLIYLAVQGLSPFETTGDDQEVALVGGLHPAVTYTFRIFAINSIDASGPTEPVVAKTQEEAPTEPPQNIKVQSAGPGELMVSWQPPPKESCNGDLLGYIVTWSEHSSSTSGVNQSKSLTVNGWATTKVQLTGLRKFTKYDISIRAFNSIASGPTSSPIVGTTQEGVPETPPTQVTCSPLSSQSVKVSWTAPPLHQHGGIIIGYKVYYRPVPTDNMDISTVGEVKKTSSMETYLHTLYKYTNYSIKVLAYTKAGDGALSPPIFCMTEEDVPGPPAGIKALALTAESILVSWLPPLQPNGNVSKYTVYSREAGSKNSNAHTMHEPPLSSTDTLTMELRDLVERQLYEFWVSATTSVGEGEQTIIVTQTTNTRAPARVASFSQVLRRAVKSSVILSCLVVGNPTPRPIWTYRNGQISTGRHYEITHDGHLNIRGLEQSVAGNYTCSASNLFGDDSITYSLVVVMPPKAPSLELQYTTTNSIRFRWNHPDNGGATIQGYVLSYKRDQGGWEEITLSPEQTEFVLSGLKCGSSYLAHLTAHNRVDTGDPSPLISATTKGTGK